MKKKMGGRLPPQRKNDIISEIRNLFNNNEIMYFSERDLSKRLDITRTTLRKYLDEIKKDIDPKDIQMVSLRFKEYLEEAIDDIRDCWKDSKIKKDKSQMRKDIDMMFKCIEKFTDFLERFHIKPKAIDNINLSADITCRQINMNVNMVSNDE